MPDWTSLLEFEFLGNGPIAWLIAAAVFLVTFTVLPIVKSLVSARARKWDEAHVPDGIELAALLVVKTSQWFILVVATWAAIASLEVPTRIERIATVVFVVAFWLQVGIWTISAIRFWLERRTSVDGKPDPQRRGSIDVLMFVAYIAVFAIVGLLALDNLGVNITALVAGLGIGGIAIALAVQTVLSDLFASLSITLDKPFEVGDFLILGDILGTVERIGIKSTRLRSLFGEQIIISNADLLSTRLHNYKRMFERRIAFTIRASYETPLEKVREIPAVLRAAVEKQERTRFDRAHFMTYGTFALEFEVVYYVLSPDYNVYADIQQAINLHILEEFASREVQFALPTRTQYARLHAVSGDDPAAEGGALS